MKSKKKYMVIFLVFIFVVSSITVIGDIKKQDNLATACLSMDFSQKEILSKSGYCDINIKGVDSYLVSPGKPVLPVFIKTFSFPINTVIHSVDCVPLTDITSEKLSDVICSASRAYPKILNKNIDNDELFFDEGIYSKDSIFPVKRFSYDVRVGLKDGEHCVFVTIKYFPIVYNPVKNTIFSVDSVDFRVNYKTGGNVFINDDSECELVVIAPRRFSHSLNSLVKHKEKHGLSTVFKTVESIVSDYNGSDSAEKIKYFIKDAIEDWGVKYVLLFGGMKHQRY